MKFKYQIPDYHDEDTWKTVPGLPCDPESAAEAAVEEYLNERDPVDPNDFSQEVLVRGEDGVASKFEVWTSVSIHFRAERSV